MRRIVWMAVALAGTMLAGSAQAQAAAPTYSGYTEIARGDFAAAERTIAEARRIAPNDADLLLNLAMVYRHTGRIGEARRLYRQVLVQPNEELNLSGDASARSRDLAVAGLAQLDRSTMARVD